MALSFTTTGVGLSANIATVASLAAQMWAKGQILVDGVRALGNGSGAGLMTCDSDGAGTNKKFEAYVVGTDTTHFQIFLRGYGAAGLLGVIQTPSVLRTALPSNGNMVNWFVAWDQTNFNYYAQLTDSAGNVFFDGTNSAIIDQGANDGNLNTTGGVNGRVTLNSSFTVSTAALVHGGAAIYGGATPPAAGTAGRWQAPAAGDANVVALWKMNDAFAGTSPSTAAAAVGAQGLVLTTSQYTWATGGSGVWFPPPAVAPPRQVRMISREAIHRSFRW